MAPSTRAAPASRPSFRAASSARSRYDLIVVGGGVSGACVMWHAAAAGMSVLLVERGELAGGPTGYSTANVRRHYSTSELAHVAALSFDFYRNFRDRTGHEAGLVSVGLLLAVKQEEVAAFEASTARLRAQGARIELIDEGTLSSMIPSIDTQGLAGAVYEPDAGYADPVLATTGLVASAAQLGGAVWTKTEVSRIVVDRGRATGVLLADSREPRADRVLVAAGCWTNDLLGPVGRPVPIQPERNAVTVLHSPGTARNVLPLVFSDRAKRYYARPEGDSLLFLGGRTTYTSVVGNPDHFERTVTFPESAEIVERASARIRPLEHLGIRRGFASLYDLSPDGVPIVDEVPGIEGLFTMCGTSGHGFRLAPGLAELAVDLIRGRRDSALDLFRVDRTYEPLGELTPR